MIHEIRTSHLKPGNLERYIEIVQPVIEQRVELSHLIGYFHTEIGPLNRVIHIWQYEDVKERDAIRAKADEIPGWPPATGELIEKMHSEIYVPAPFLPDLDITRNIGPLFELRAYTYPPGAIPSVIDAWSTRIEKRMELSQPVGIWYSEFGQLNRWLHMWAYESLEHRKEARQSFGSIGWPPPSSSKPIEQENILLSALPFSPVQ